MAEIPGMNVRPGLSYLLAHPDTLSLTFSAPLLLLGLAALPLFLWRERATIDARLRWLRASAWTLIVLAAAGAALSAYVPHQQLAVVALVDHSASIDEEGRRWQQRYVNELAAALAPDDELAIVGFSGEAQVLQPPAAPIAVDMSADPIGASTDIGTALDTALALFPPDSERRLVLLTDGNDTRGRVDAAAARAASAGVKIYAAVPPHQGGPDAAVEKLALPVLVPEETVFPVRVVVRNYGVSTRGTVTLSVDSKSIGKEAVDLAPGLNSIEIPYRMQGAGSHRIRAEILVDGDVVAANNSRETTLMVGTKPRVLVIADHQRSALSTILQRKDLDVVVVAPGSAPGRVEDLLPYHCVVLDDVAAAAIGAPRLAAIERYVRDFGGGFILVGGTRTYGDPGFKKTALERLLPVTLEARKPPRAERPPLSLMLLLDRSNSMGWHVHREAERSETESKLAYAKRAALAVVQQLKDSDNVGLIAFDVQPYEIAALRPLKQNRAVLEKTIPLLHPDGGTDFLEALEMARRELVAQRSGLAHIILLTDGATNRAAAEHDVVIAELAGAGITATSIRIGAEAEGVELQRALAQKTGGQFYHIDDATMLPQLLLKDTSRALAQAPREDARYSPRLVAASQALRGLRATAFPDVQGYALAHPKDGAEVLLQLTAGDSKDPLLASWQYGLGRVVAFTASLDDDAETWIGWDGFGKFWSQIVHWALRDQAPWEQAIEVDEDAAGLSLTVRTFGDTSATPVVARLLVDPAHPIDLALTATGLRTFSSPLPPLHGGRFPLIVITRGDAGTPAQTTTFVTIPERGSQTMAAEYAVRAPNLALLNQITSSTGGAVDEPLRNVVARGNGTKRIDYPLDWWLVPAAMVLFLVEIALRRLQRGE